MNPIPFLTVDQQPIYLQQALQYLQTSGKLAPLIGDIVRQHIIERELAARPELELDPTLLQQVEIDFRLQNRLTDPQSFQQWLNQKGIDYPTFHRQVTLGVRVGRLKAVIAEPFLQEYFNERKPLLDRVVLSRLIVNKKEVANKLRTKIQEGANFEQLVRDNSVAEDRVVNGRMGAISIGTLPDKLKAAISIDKVTSGEIVGPIEVETGSWGLFRVDQVLPASLEDPKLREILQNDLFNRWLAERIQKMNIQIQLT